MTLDAECLDLGPRLGLNRRHLHGTSSLLLPVSPGLLSKSCESFSHKYKRQTHANTNARQYTTQYPYFRPLLQQSSSPQPGRSMAIFVGLTFWLWRISRTADASNTNQAYNHCLPRFYKDNSVCAL